MIALDTNVLVHAFRADSPHHAAASGAVNALVNSGERVGVPWPCVHEFLAVVTNPRAFVQPSSSAEALTSMNALLSQESVSALGESRRHLATLGGLLAASRAVGPKVHDARIAAICLDHGVDELWTADRDFSYFPALTTRNPLVST